MVSPIVLIVMTDIVLAVDDGDDDDGVLVLTVNDDGDDGNILQSTNSILHSTGHPPL